MKVLVLNSGSSSVKFKVFDGRGIPKEIAKGIVERIGLPGTTLKYSSVERRGQKLAGKPESERSSGPMPDHAAAIAEISKVLLDPEVGVIKDVSELGGVGHRVVHGGEHFSGSVPIDDSVVQKIEECARLAPLHNPPALLGIRAVAKTIPTVPQVAVFDTAFHHTIPEKAYLYAIPKEYYEQYGIRKYGFHGISHQYVAQEAARIMKQELEAMKIITCHLGNGCSITAVEGGKSVDTSMGLTPLAGVMMGTRSGDLDPYIPIFMMKQLGMTADEVEATLNKESGLEGISSYTDVRDVIDHMVEGDRDCELALDMFAYRVAGFVGSYAMVMNGADAIVFTGGIGEKDPAMRARILSSATYLGVELDYRKNARNDTFITKPKAKVKVLVIPTDEELVIARETFRIVMPNPAAGTLTSAA